MKAGGAAQRYAKALFGLAQDERRHREVRAELDRLKGIFGGSREVAAALLTPMHPAAERKAALRALAAREHVSPLVQNFLGFLVDQRRLIQFDAIVEAYNAFADQAEGMLTAEVKVASPLDDRRKDRLRRALSERTGREVKLEIEVDPSLIGGAIAKVGDLVFDGSLRTQLSQLRANLS
ncbi:F0F1 ATP synthase subunit delta [Myxococcota bacterium]|nr:F0F1 ATP synthase subunit delta [Myxococcota bacterium]